MLFTTRTRRIVLSALAGLAVLAVAAFVLGRMWIDSYLRSDRFRQMLEEKTGETLQAQVKLGPLDYRQGGFYADRMEATGSATSWFSAFEVSRVRAAVSARRLAERVWQVDEVTAEQAVLRLDGERTGQTEQQTLKLGKKKAPGVTLPLPNRVEVGSATISKVTLSWPGGTFDGARLGVVPHEGGWNFLAAGGIASHRGLPPADLDTLRVRYRSPTLFIQEARLRPKPGGTVQITGEVDPSRSLDLEAKLDGVPVTELLSEDWRVRLTGDLHGTVRVQSALPVSGAPILSGTMDLMRGELQALPVLDQIATFTRTAQFRRLQLSRARATFQQDGAGWNVTEFLMESGVLLRATGAFTVRDGNIDGTFDVGVSPSTLQWLPGSQTRVFTTSRDGYVWTPVRLTGPVAEPKEDLTPRLLAAAQGEILEKLETTTREGVKELKDAAKSALDLLLGR